MEMNLAFESFMVFYLLEVLFLSILAWQINKEYQVEDQRQQIAQASQSGPSASDLIRMRQKVKELQRQK